MKRLEILDQKCVAKNSPGFLEKFDHILITKKTSEPILILNLIGINPPLPKQMLH